MKNIPTDLLRTFVTIQDLGGFTSAGEFLGRSQPAISLQIKKLEETLNTKLFLRGSTLALTSNGDYVYHLAKKMLETNDEIVNRVTGENVKGKVKIGIPNDLELTFLPKALRSFSKIYPSISVEVGCDISRVIQKKYQQNFYDIILVMEEVNSQEKRDSRDYRIEPLEWVMSPDYSILEGEALSLITHPQGCLYRKISEEALSTQCRPYRTTYTSTSLLGLLSAVEAGLGITVMAQSTVPERLKGTLGTSELPPLANVSIGLYYNKEALNAAAQRVVDFLRSGIANLEKNEHL
ncbi:LysR family transcriptional regulator [Halomonas garicola]|uniref:LysR family transcriptional regulator n=1 Tax=Halomonas garicola TaxID=1690008 RepID=UPI002897617E|nr:LysR family transcriptional regulator [Halomonas garicola]